MEKTMTKFLIFKNYLLFLKEILKLSNKKNG